MKLCKVLSFIMFSHSGIVALHIKNVVPQLNVSTVQSALSLLRRVINNYPMDDVATGNAYEKEHSVTLLKCAKVLYDIAREQILQTLQEVDSRKAYWQDQKNHQWRYFLTKNPVKWVAGQSQKAEIDNNIEQLQSYQGELYVLLGQLAQLGSVYDHEHKTVFMTDYKNSYEWIAGLLDLLSRIKVEMVNVVDSSLFITSARQLQLKLEKVRRFKYQILSEISQTQVPSHLEQNWLKYGILMYLLGYGYNRADQIGTWGSTSVAQSKDYVTGVAGGVKSMFFPGEEEKGGLIFQQGNLDQVQSAGKNFLENLKKNNIISSENLPEVDNVIQGRSKVSSELLQKVMNENIMSSKWNAFLYGTQAWNILIQLLALHGGRNIEKEIAGVRNVALLAPAGIIGWAGYRGLSGIYQTFMASDYTVIRRALLDINSLFVDQAKPLDDERYGKMIYLIYSLKQQAMKYLPYAIQESFLDDLDTVESKEFDVAAKRRIVDDMFRKYSFLGSV